MMKVRSESPNAWSLVLAAGLVACGAGSTLDDYSEGVPEVVPVPIRLGDAGARDGGVRDGGSDAGRADGGRQDGGQQGGGQQGGGQQGGGDVGESCEATDECLAGGECLTNVNVLGIVQLDFPGGYCTKRPCANDSECPSGSGCQTATMTCLQICTRNSECRSNEGYQCAAPPLGGGTGGAGAVRYCLPNSVANIGGLAGGAGGTTGGFLAGLGGLLGGLGGAGGTTR